MVKKSMEPLTACWVPRTWTVRGSDPPPAPAGPAPMTAVAQTIAAMRAVLRTAPFISNLLDPGYCLDWPWPLTVLEAAGGSLERRWTGDCTGAGHIWRAGAVGGVGRRPAGAARWPPAAGRARRSVAARRSGGAARRAGRRRVG